jgi:hypothetical protein
MDRRGIEPLLSECKTEVLPLSLPARLPHGSTYLVGLRYLQFTPSQLVVKRLMAIWVDHMHLPCPHLATKALRHHVIEESNP